MAREENGMRQFLGKGRNEKRKKSRTVDEAAIYSQS